MAKNHDSLATFSAQCLAAEMLSLEVKTEREDGNVTHHVNLEKAYRTRTFAREILFFMAEEVRSGIRKFRKDFIKCKFFGQALDEATAKTKSQHVIQYISYWRRGRVIRRFWGFVPITAQDTKQFTGLIRTLFCTSANTCRISSANAGTCTATSA